MSAGLTARDLFLAGRREAVLGPTRFDRAIIDTDGSDVNVVLNASAVMGEEVMRFCVNRQNALSISTARGEDLDRRVHDLYQLLRQQASSAVATLRFDKSSDQGLTILAGSRFGTDSGVTFRTLVDVAFPTNGHGPYYAVATCERAGTEGSVGIGLITRILTPLGDQTITVTNPEAAAGGGVAWSDDEFRAIARDFFITARRGTREAIEFGALQAEGVSEATATEDLDATTGSPNGRVQLYIADQVGQANTALSDLVLEQLAEYRGAGVPVSVIPSVPQYINLVATGLQFEAGANTGQVLNTAALALLATVNALAPGETLRRADLLGVLSRIEFLIVPDGALTEPLGDVVPSVGSVLRTTRDRIILNG